MCAENTSMMRDPHREENVCVCVDWALDYSRAFLCGSTEANFSVTAIYHILTANIETVQSGNQVEICELLFEYGLHRQ